MKPFNLLLTTPRAWKIWPLLMFMGWLLPDARASAAPTVADPAVGVTIWSCVTLLIAGFFLFLVLRLLLRNFPTEKNKAGKITTIAIVAVSTLLLGGCALTREIPQPNGLSFKSSEEVNVYMSRLTKQYEQAVTSGTLTKSAPTTSDSAASASAAANKREPLVTSVTTTQTGGQAATSDFDGGTLGDVWVYGSQDVSTQDYSYYSGYGGDGPGKVPGPGSINGPGDGSVLVHGQIVTIRVKTSSGVLKHVFNLRIEKGKITNVTSLYTGLVMGSTYFQDDYVNVDDVDYHVDVIFHITQQGLFIEGLGTVYVGDIIHAEVYYDPIYKRGTVKYHR